MDLPAEEPLRDFADRAIRDALQQPENLTTTAVQQQEIQKMSQTIAESWIASP
jgi:hypothetical protein